MIFRRLQEAEQSGRHIRVAVVGSGFVARGLIHQLKLTPGMTPSLVIARSAERANMMLQTNGIEAVDEEVGSQQLDDMVREGKTALVSEPSILSELSSIDVVVEATGDTSFGAKVALEAFAAGCHVVSLNYETDATVGPILKVLADQSGVVYTGSDGDQPGVMQRLVEYVEGIGLETVAAINCKGFLDRHATPDSIRPWAEKQKTSLHMTTAFTDGTKMNVENVSVANATGLLPEVRGMHGVETTMADALTDFRSALSGTGVVDYTLGGDFGSGVFVIATGAHEELAAPYLQYLKMGDGPWYLFFRPWHLVQFETPISIAEAALDNEPTIAPIGAPVAEVVSLAKRDLDVGTVIDGIGGYDVYGEIDKVSDSTWLPIGLAPGVTVTRKLAKDEPITLNDVDVPNSALWTLLSHQTQHFEAGTGADLDSMRRAFNSA